MIKKLPISRTDQIRAIRLLAEGDILLRERKDHLAMLKYVEASDANPYHEAVFNKLAVAYLRLRMHSQAEAAIDRAIRLQSDYAYAYNTRGILKLNQELPKDALKSFRKAISIDSSVATFYINLGYCHIQLSQPREARKAYGTALKMNPDLFSDEDVMYLSHSGTTQQSPEKYFELAKVFAELDNLDYTLKYLGQAFATGFSDSTRILMEDSFRRFHSNEKFKRFLLIHGITL